MRAEKGASEGGIGKGHGVGGRCTKTKGEEDSLAFPVSLSIATGDGVVHGRPVRRALRKVSATSSIVEF